MAKRFTDTDKWKKPFIRTMKAPYKLLWLYILDECDHAGIWHVDLEVAQIRTGEKIKLDVALQQFDGRVIAFDNGEKWFIPDFVSFQYGELNILNRAHKSVIDILSKYNLLNESEGVFKHLTSTLQGAKDKDKDKEQDKVKDITREKVSDIQTNYTEYKNEVLSGWQNLNSFLNDKCPRVQSLKTKITIDNYNEHSNLYDSELGRNTLLQMENFKPLTIKYTSAHLTFLNWTKNGNTETTNQRSNPGDRFHVGESSKGTRPLGT